MEKPLEERLGTCKLFVAFRLAYKAERSGFYAQLNTNDGPCYAWWMSFIIRWCHRFRLLMRVANGALLFVLHIAHVWQPDLWTTARLQHHSLQEGNRFSCRKIWLEMTWPGKRPHKYWVTNKGKDVNFILLHNMYILWTVLLPNIQIMVTPVLF